MSFRVADGPAGTQLRDEAIERNLASSSFGGFAQLRVRNLPREITRMDGEEEAEPVM